MTFTIHSRKYNRAFTFFCKRDGGYVWLNDRQICHGGDFRGNTVTAKDEDDLRRVARRWYRQHMADEFHTDILYSTPY